MSNKLFDTIRLLGELILPALATLYAALGAIWGWPYVEAVVKSAAAVTTCIGAIVIGLRKQYKKEDKKEDKNGENG